MGLVHKVPHLIHPERRVPWKTQLIRYSYVETPNGLQIVDPDERHDYLIGSYMTVITQLDTTEYGKFNTIFGGEIQTTAGLLNPLAVLDESQRDDIHSLIDDPTMPTTTLPMLFTSFWWSKQQNPKTVRLPIYRLKLHMEI